MATQRKGYFAAGRFTQTGGGFKQAPSGETDAMDYKITNPYAAVDWDTFGRYRTQLHAHTLYSDGSMNIADAVEAYYALGYDILAITDHGVVHTGWNRPHEMIPVISFNQYLRKNDLSPMTDARYRQITTGADRGGRPMLDVTQGLEMNALTMRKNHVNGFFCGWGAHRLGKEEDYETCIAGTEAEGGLSVINHPGDYIAAARNVGRVYDWSNLAVFTDALLAHPKSCVGVEAFNSNDRTERYDRILWDRLLMYCIPRGRNVFGFSNDDSHDARHIGLTAEIMLLPELSETALRTAMETGAFFACSKIAHVELGEDFEGSGNFAEVKRITVDDANVAITVTAEGAETIEWIANGSVIAEGSTLRLREHAEKIGAYVRFQIKNEGGLLLSQPFICDDGAMERHLIPAPPEAAHPGIKKIGAFFRRNLLGELIYRSLVLEKRVIKL